jgi:hypothetical protein
MFLAPSERCESCKHYTGGKLFNQIETKDEFVEGDFLPTCKAFPDGIPEEISIGKNKHDKITKEQVGEYVYEPVK